ncbi:glycosyltransferase [Azospirillum oleiclasticum]|uniref:glycosyltransferase n=1 Tax=Azospirillum oleiclasticum TaxID=2735135 RepID=UPI0015D4A97C
MDQDSDTLSRLSRPISLLVPDLIVAPPSWLGHVPFAFWITGALNPGTFVELGTHTGNSYAAFCQAVKHLELPTACFAVDTWAGDPQAGYYGDEVHRALADFHDPRYGAFSRLMRMTFDEAAGHFSDGTIDLLHIDGLHTYEAVRHDFETWRAKLSRRGVVLFHDTNVRKDDFGVWRLWEELSAQHPHFTFLHSNGLGVLGVGDELPDDLRWLFAAQVENGPRLRGIRAFFDRLGGGVVNTQQAQQRAAEIEALRAEIAGLHDSVRGKLDEIRGLMTTVAERDGSIATLQGWVADRDSSIADRDSAIAALQGEIAGRMDEIRGLMTTVAERDGSIATLQGWVADRDSSIADRDSAIAALQGEIAGRMDEIRGLMTTVAERDGSIATLQGWVADRDSSIAGLNGELGRTLGAVAERDRTIDALQGEIDNLRAGVAGMETMLRNAHQQLHAVYHSTSWKLSAPVRRLGRLALRLRRLHRSRLHRMMLTPLHDVRVADGAFESTGVDPAFRLASDQGRPPTGWCLLSFRVTETSVPLAPLLYIDTGNGFGEGGTIRLPPVASGTVETVLLLPAETKGLRFDPTDRPARFAIDNVTVREIGKLQVLGRALGLYRGRMGEAMRLLRENGLAVAKQKLVQELMPKGAALDYPTWVQLYDTLSPHDRGAIAEGIARLTRKPLISIVMPVYNTPDPYLRRALDTVIDQLYPHWELCIADDASTAPHVAATLAEYARRDPRIKVVRRPANGHISAASNTALELATGEFVALMDHDDELPPHALYVVALEIENHPDLDILYSDEDKIDEAGVRYDPYFKSDWNYDLFCGQNMISHLGVFRRTLLEAIGGFRVGYEGSQDYDLVLRAVEKTEAARIRHVPHILYHWRVFSSSSSFSTTALPTATNAARRALQDHFDRIGVPARVEPAPGAEWYSRIAYPLPDPLPLVSLLVPTRDKLDLLRQCVDGLLDGTDYPNLEVLILDNNSEEPATLEWFAALEGRPRVRVLRYEGAFNFSAINNFGVEHAKGELIGLINNDIKVIEPGWLKEMVSHAVRPEVGAVGAKLYYGDDTIQHAGVVTGINGVANHIHKHLPREHPGHFGRLRLVQDMSVVTAACLVMRRSVFDAVGGLDAGNLAVAFNDVDLCLKVREAGHLVVWTPHAELYHLESASRGSDMAPDKINRFMGEIRHMHARWGRTLLNDPYYNPNLTLDAGDFSLAFPPRLPKPWLPAATTVEDPAKEGA